MWYFHRVDETKVCTRCRLTKPLDDFARKRADREWRHSWCKVCQKSYKDSHYASNKPSYFALAKKHRERLRDLVRSVKESKPCADCGRRYPHYVMDFDHRDPTTKKFNIGHLSRDVAGEKAILDEIAKCDLVCSNCHRERTHGDKARSSKG